MTTRRKFLKNAGIGLAGAAAVSAPAVHSQTKSTITWRLQTYAGPSLAAHVIKPAIAGLTSNIRLMSPRFRAAAAIATAK